MLTAKLAPEWASFPTLAGRSFYGQPVKKYSRLKSFYNVNLIELRRMRDENRHALSISKPSRSALAHGFQCATTALSQSASESLLQALPTVAWAIR